MRVVTLFGTRPEIIRLSLVIPRIDRFAEQILVHTGQNYDPNLSDVFFRELRLREADVHLGIKTTNFAAQVGQILEKSEALLARLRPDRLLILGDTNSGLASIVAVRMRIPVYHMEAGNRCYDDRVPEEINRRVIDHCSSVLMPYTHRSMQNLIREGIARERIFVIGNPIFEVLSHYEPEIEASDILQRLDVQPKEYFLVTLHRAENVDESARLESFLDGLARVADTYVKSVVVSVHPRTHDKLGRFGLSPTSPRVRLLESLGFPAFVKLERHALCVLSDSGTVQEECCIFRIPNVTLRDVTERPETIECGSNILTGGDPESILRAVDIALSEPAGWQAPAEYTERNVSQTVAKILLGYSLDSIR